MTESVYIAIGHGLSVLVLAFICFCLWIKSFLSKDNDTQANYLFATILFMMINVFNFCVFYFDTLKKALIVSGYILK